MLEFGSVDGSGLADPRPRPDALGLVSMRERAQRWGGRMEIGSDERGCRVRVRVPATRRSSERVIASSVFGPDVS